MAIKPKPKIVSPRNDAAIKRARLRIANREKFKNVRPVKSKVVESGVGNIPMTIARAASAIAKRTKKPLTKAKTNTKNQGLSPAIKAEMARDKNKVEKQMAKMASDRKKVEAKGKLGDAKAAQRDRLVALYGKPSDRPKKFARPPSKQKSIPYTDRFGNTGWR